MEITTHTKRSAFSGKAFSSLSSDASSHSPAALYGGKKGVKIGFYKVPLFWANLFFAFVVLVSKVGENVSLPLWIDSTNGNTSAPPVDSYFILSFSSILFTAIYGIGTLFIRIFMPKNLGETERNFPHLLFFLVGFFDALNGTLVVFASKGSRTPPYLQAILGNFLIPLTVLFRLLILRKKPTRLKLNCGIVVVVGLSICLIPTIFPQVDPKAGNDPVSTPLTDDVSRVMWPIIFMLGCLPEAIMHVLEERGVKLENESSQEQINLVYFLFWTSFYELLCVVFLFWTDILPWYGNLDHIKNFGSTWWCGIQCFFGGAGCSATPGLRGSLYMATHVLVHVAGANLLRHAEGATWLSIVTSLVTPLGFIFWTLFNESPFKWHPEGHVSTWFSIGALVIMVPAIFVYNIGEPEISLNSDGGGRQEIFCSSHSFVEYHSAASPEEPLLSEKSQSTNYSSV